MCSMMITRLEISSNYRSMSQSTLKALRIRESITCSPQIAILLAFNSIFKSLILFSDKLSRLIFRVSGTKPTSISTAVQSFGTMMVQLRPCRDTWLIITSISLKSGVSLEILIRKSTLRSSNESMKIWQTRINKRRQIISFQLQLTPLLKIRSDYLK